MFYEQEEDALFWESLDALDTLGAPQRVAEAVNILTQWAVRDPRCAAPVERGVRVLKLPSTYLRDGMTPPLRLAFFLDETPRPSGAAGVVLLLHISAYDEAAELLESAPFPGPH